MSVHNYLCRNGVDVCVYCGYVRNVEKPTACSGTLPEAGWQRHLAACSGVLPKVETRRGELEGTPPGTRLSFLTPDGVVVVMGTPGDEHNCDAMGCGSVSDHVVERINVRELREQNALLLTERETLRSALRSIAYAVESEAREARHAITAADDLWAERAKP